MGRTGRTTIQGKYGDTLKIVAVDENGNIVGVLQGIDAGGILRTLKVDSNGQIISVIKGDQGIVAQDASNRLISVIKGSEALDVKQKAVTGELITVMQGNQGVDVAQQATGELVSVIKGDQGIVAQDASNRLISVIKGSEGLNVKQQAITGELVSVMQGLDGATLRTVAVDGAGNIIGVMKGNDAGTLRTLKVDASGQMVTLIKGSLGESITVDEAGNLVSIIKGDYAGTLKTVATDAGGRMLVTPAYNNPIIKNLFYSGSAVAPHNYTERALYTIPAGKAAVLYGGSARIRINTAAGTPRQRVAGVAAKVGGILTWQIYTELSAIHNTIGQFEADTMSIGMPLQAGHQVQCYSADFSTGGSCDIKTVASVMEYDL